jgi:hypothetical protein
VKVFVELTHFAATAGRSALRDRVAALEDAGATGVAVSDHVFLTGTGDLDATAPIPAPVFDR